MQIPHLMIGGFALGGVPTDLGPTLSPFPRLPFAAPAMNFHWSRSTASRCPGVPVLMTGSLQDLWTLYQPILRPILRIGPIFGGIAMLSWRVREQRVAVTAKTILIPPIAMSTGFFMFISPLMRVPWSWAIVSLTLGAFVLSYPLLSSSRLVDRDGEIFMHRSRVFLWVLLGLLAIRLALHDWIGHLISPLQTAAVFYLVAFGMIVRWRGDMYRQYHALRPRGA
jgi:membrane protein CcdC involved in cytochrome C biogenesis